MLFSRQKPTPRVHEKSLRAGLDVTSSRIRAAVRGSHADRPVVLDAPHLDLACCLHLDRKPIEVGSVALGSLRRAPHQICANFLPHVGAANVWKSGRQTLSADAALGTAFARIAPILMSEADAIGLALPSYLTPPQAVQCAAIAAANKLPITGTVVAPLAVVADRAEAILADDPIPEETEDRPGIVPIRMPSGGPGSAVVVDVDDYAMTASVVWVDRGEARILQSATWPKLSQRVWLDRLIDAIADRCVRLCRRDPRESADAEQSLFEQLLAALDRTNPSQPLSFHLRAAHWFQDVIVPPVEFEAIGVPLVSQAIQGLTELIYASGVPAPPRAIWSMPSAARLPGLSAAVYENSAESTAVATMSSDAVAGAAARLAPRWHAGELPRTHMDRVLPIAMSAPALPAREAVRAQRG